MSKYRVYELAKEYNTTSKVIIDILNRNGLTAKNHMSSVDDQAKAVIDRTFARKTGTIESTAEKRDTAPPSQSTVNQQTGNFRNTGGAIQPAKAAAAGSKEDKRPNNQQRDNRSPQSGQRLQDRPQGGHTGTQGGLQSHQPYQSNPVSRQANQPLPRHSQQGQRSHPGLQGQAGQPKAAGQQHGDRRSNQQNARPAQPGQQGQGFARMNQQSRPQQGRPGASAVQGPRPAAQDEQRRAKSNLAGPNAQQPKPSAKPGSARKDNKGKDQYTSGKHERQLPKNQPRHGHQGPKTEPPKPKIIKLGESITVKDLAGKLGREVGEVIKKLMMLGVMATINQEVDFDTASIVAGEFSVTVEALPPEEDPTEIPEIEDSPENLQPRPPVVTIMGHVDHGKTSLLDAIRQTNVTSQEAGGITQHIGAYQVNHQGKKIVFLDTPGHEAFTSMRARGAQVTDIAILVVAADDGVMPQTIEAINHAKSAKVPIIVAINKMDRPGANPDRVKQQLSEHGLVPEDWGGDTIMVPVSAYKKTGLGDLLEMILLVAEIQELKANSNRPAQGTIIEAQLDKGRGPVATVLVQKGTLHTGDSIIAGTAFGKVRAMISDRGDKIKKAGPSTPVEVLGLSDVPMAGDILYAVDEKIARAVAEKRLAKKRTEEMNQAQKVSLDDLFKHIQEGTIKDLNIVVKADVQGSIEALRQALTNLKNKEVRVNIVHAGVGAINESDVMLASASNALIIGFNVRPDANARKAAENEKIDIRTYRVIYEALNDVEAAMTGMLAPEYKEVVQGRAEVRKVIPVPKAVVAGSYVLEGKITNNSQIRIIRNGIVIHEGKIDTLRRFKDDVKEVVSGYECGISIEKFRDIKEGDILEAFAMEVVKQGASPS